MRKKVFYVLVISLLFVGCSLPTDDTKNTAKNAFNDVAVANSFSVRGEISLSWQQDDGANEFILIRSVDGLEGIIQTTEVYRGGNFFYVDDNVTPEVRYIYRLDKSDNNGLLTGNETAIAVGNDSVPDLNEPNNNEQDATFINQSESGSIYYYRFSDGRILTDTDWFWVQIVRGSSQVFRITEDIDLIDKNRYSIVCNGNNIVVDENGYFTIQNSFSNDNNVAFSITPVIDQFVLSGLTGGTLRNYMIEKKASVGSDVTDDSNTITDNTVTNTAIAGSTTLFKLNNSGWIEFKTNSTEYSGISKTFWSDVWSYSGNFTGMTVSLVKESGSNVGGFGFYVQGGQVNGKEQMLVVMIRTTGFYSVGKVIDGNYQDIVPWTSNSYIVRGFGAVNNLSIKYDIISSKYLLFINGSKTGIDFTDPTPICNGQKAGIVSVLSSLESFPAQPVKVLYKLK